MSMFTVYILYSPKYNKTYVGFTSDLDARIQSHNELATKGWTLKFRPWTLIHTEQFDTKKDAMNREKWFKTGVGRDSISNYILKKRP